MNLPDPIRRIADQLKGLPGIGPRQAIRLAFYLVGQGRNAIDELSSAAEDLKRMKACSRCFFPHQDKNNLCDICLNPRRDKYTIAILEKETDLVSIENTKKYNGRYLVLGPISKTGALLDFQKLRLQSLKNYIQKELGGKAEEIILAFNPTSYGDFIAASLAKELDGFAKKISRLGRGLPTGGEIEFADDETLGSALERRG